LLPFLLSCGQVGSIVEEDMKNLTAMKITLFALIIIGIAVVFFLMSEYFTFDRIIMHKDAFKQLAKNNYIMSVAVFIAVYVSTAFFIPGALLLSLLAGFLFGTILGAIYINVGATIGATLSFLAARYLLGNWIQRKYAVSLSAFNEEVSANGHRYLFTLRVAPIMPFFLVNLFAGLTKISLKKFVIVTALGILPGSLIYANAGRQLASIESPGDVMSWKIVLSIVILVIFVLMPVIVEHLRRALKRQK